VIYATGKRARGPHYDLEVLKACVRADNFHVYKSRALDIVQQVFKCGKVQARTYVREIVLSLEAADYSHTLRHPNGAVQDVYGKLIQGEGWYIKIEIDFSDGEAGVISCHPAERELSTRRGVLPPTWRKGYP
jgi:hypothetical protein